MIWFGGKRATAGAYCAQHALGQPSVPQPRAAGTRVAVPDALFRQTSKAAQARLDMHDLVAVGANPLGALAHGADDLLKLLQLCRL